MYGLNELHRIIARYGIEAVRKEIKIAASLEDGYDKELVDTMDKYDAAEREQKEIFANNFEEDFDFGELDSQEQECWNDAEAAQEAASEKLDELTTRSANRRLSSIISKPK